MSRENERIENLISHADAQKEEALLRQWREGHLGHEQALAELKRIMLARYGLDKYPRWCSMRPVDVCDSEYCSDADVKFASEHGQVACTPDQFELYEEIKEKLPEGWSATLRAHVGRCQRCGARRRIVTCTIGMRIGIEVYHYEVTLSKITNRICRKGEPISEQSGSYPKKKFSKR